MLRFNLLCMFGVCVLESALSFCAGFLYKSCMTYFFSRTVTMAQKSSGFVLKPLKPEACSYSKSEGCQTAKAVCGDASEGDGGGQGDGGVEHEQQQP